MTAPEILIVGAGISGLAAARTLAEHGVPARVIERGRVSGGRLASRSWQGRRIDLGAAYLTAEPGSDFDGVVRDWLARGLAREWTDRFAVAGPDGITGETSGPMRYASPTGLRALVEDLAVGVDVALETPASTIGDGMTLLAMPDPQARRLLPAGSAALGALDALDGGDEWLPTIAVALRWEQRIWAEDLHGVFVNDSPDIGFIADDGDRRGDGAPVLVVHSTPGLASRHLDDPAGAVPAVLAATLRVLGSSVDPAASFAHRWSFARPSRPHPEPYLLTEGVGICGDGWGGRSSVGAAWTSGHALAGAVAARLG